MPLTWAPRLSPQPWGAGPVPPPGGHTLHEVQHCLRRGWSQHRPLPRRLLPCPGCWARRPAPLLRACVRAFLPPYCLAVPWPPTCPPAPGRTLCVGSRSALWCRRVRLACLWLAERVPWPPAARAAGGRRPLPSGWPRPCLWAAVCFPVWTLPPVSLGEPCAAFCAPAGSRLCDFSGISPSVSRSGCFRVYRRLGFLVGKAPVTALPAFLPRRRFCLIAEAGEGVRPLAAMVPRIGQRAVCGRVLAACPMRSCSERVVPGLWPPFSSRGSCGSPSTWVPARCPHPPGLCPPGGRVAPRDPVSAYTAVRRRGPRLTRAGVCLCCWERGSCLCRILNVHLSRPLPGWASSQLLDVCGACPGHTNLRTPACSAGAAVRPLLPFAVVFVSDLWLVLTWFPRVPHLQRCTCGF